MIMRTDLYPMQTILQSIINQNAAKIEIDKIMGSQQGGITVTAESIKSATLMVSTIPIIIVYPFIQKHFTKGMMIGSIKE